MIGMRYSDIGTARVLAERLRGLIRRGWLRFDGRLSMPSI